MKFKNVFFGVIVFVLFSVVLTLPALFTGKYDPALVGPELSSLAFEEIYFSNGDLQLAGMLFTPEGEGPFQVAVIIHGSGASKRTNKWYLSVARHLQKNGIAVLLPDKRGSEKSEGSWVGSGFETLAGDTMAAVEYIRNQESLNNSGIGLVGMSQGGWIAPIVAAEDENIDFVVSMSGAAVATRRQLLHEETHNLSRYTWPFVARLLAPMTTKRILKMEHVKSFGGYDPIPYWMKVNVPVFFAFGENDENVPVDASVKVLREKLNIDLIKVYPDGGHAVRDRETNRIQDEFLDDLVAFIKRSQSKVL